MTFDGFFDQLMQIDESEFAEYLCADFRDGGYGLDQFCMVADRAMNDDGFSSELGQKLIAVNSRIASILSRREIERLAGRAGLVERMSSAGIRGVINSAK